MSTKPSAKDVAAKERHLPPMFQVGDVIAPKAPQTIAEARLEEGTLTDLCLKLAYSINRFTYDYVVKRLHVAPNLAESILEQLSREGLVEQSMLSSDAKTRYRITDRGRQHAERSLEVCAYLGPAPVSLEAYAAMLRWQFAATPVVKPDHVLSALQGLVLPERAIQMAGLAVSSGRSLFVYGPSGNGKTSIGRQIHRALSGDYWIPHCISVRNSVIRLFDEQVHHRVEVPTNDPFAIDNRWVRIRRPLVVVGGELTLEYLDLVYSPTLRYYEAPPHLKSNGGVFLVDDFGRERISPIQLLNRFITPMEHHIDYFTLSTGQKIQIPLRHILIIATNLGLETVTDPAFLRRMGYRLLLEAPTPEAYAKIFENYAKSVGANVDKSIIDSLLERYKSENRELRACEPRDLVERSRDVCSFRSKPLELTPEVLDLAWIGYFGTEQRKAEVQTNLEVHGNATGSS
jgi:DNA-binding MarR family transcriptional regulator